MTKKGLTILTARRKCRSFSLDVSRAYFPGEKMEDTIMEGHGNIFALGKGAAMTPRTCDDVRFF